ncbi:MAG: hypothetical protein ACR2MD_18535 [Aridibacter sp.]
MKNKISIFIFALFLMLSFGSVEQILACVCAETELWCQFSYGVDEVFVGKIIKKETFSKEVEIPENKTPITIEINQHKVAVNKTFTKIKNNSEIILVNDGTTCDFDFKIDETYLIWAYRTDDGKLTTNICSPTKLLKNAKAELKFLENVDKNQEPLRICGTAFDKASVMPINKLQIDFHSILFPKRELLLDLL